MTASVQVRVDIGGADYIPHTFLVVTHPNGTVSEYGLVPAAHGTMSGAGRIDLTGSGGVPPHEYQFATPATPLTGPQYSALIDFIGGSVVNPPNYLVTDGWSSVSGSENCTGWAIKAWAAAGLPTSFGLTTQGTWNPYGQAFGLSLRYLSAQMADGFATLDANTFRTNIPSVNVMSVIVNTAYTSALTWAPPQDPLVLDLNGGGISTVGISPVNPILFDHNADGIKTGTGWLGAGEGILTLDINGNGTVDSGRELFGDNTALASGPNIGQLAANGFVALAQHDKDINGVADGKIDSADAIYSQLRIWQDVNQDGVSQATELQTLAALGVQSINVTGTASNINLGGGNTQTWTGGFTRTSGQTGVVGAADLAGSLTLAANNFYREFTDDPATTSAAQTLPQMQGSGQVRDLREAMRFRMSANDTRWAIAA